MTENTTSQKDIQTVLTEAFEAPKKIARDQKADVLYTQACRKAKRLGKPLPKSPAQKALARRRAVEKTMRAKFGVFCKDVAEGTLQTDALKAAGLKWSDLNKLLGGERLEKQYHRALELHIAFRRVQREDEAERRAMVGTVSTVKNSSGEAVRTTTTQSDKLLEKQLEVHHEEYRPKDKAGVVFNQNTLTLDGDQTLHSLKRVMEESQGMPLLPAEERKLTHIDPEDVEIDGRKLN